jgi:PqqD family protein of HPr-rel-A system
MAWRVQAAGRFYDAGESSVIYFDPHSGDTHLLSDFAAHLIREIAEAPMSTPELIERVAGQVDSDPENQEENVDLPGAIESVLSELLSLDILAHD